MALHAFVAMPFGVKEGIDFNRIYAEYIQPALADFEVFRADQEQRAGEIRTDMFQELLVADLVVADLTLDNPNVWYELGIRHALRARGVVLTYAEGVRQGPAPFDVYTDRRVRYRLKDGAPDPATLKQDREALAAFVKATMASWWGRKHSPVYQLLDLREPDWKSLMLRDDENRARFRDWCNRIETAGRRKRPGDVVVLAGEAPTLLLRAEGRVTAAKALLNLGSYRFALDQIQKALEADPQHLEGRRVQAVLLGRMGKRAEAEQELERLTTENPRDPELRALTGRVRKESWMAEWNDPALSPDQRRARAIASIHLLADCVEPYLAGFRLDPGHYYSGINALTLLYLRKYLDGGEPPELGVLQKAVRWAAESAAARDPDDYWSRASVAELELSVGTEEKIAKTYRDAVRVAQRRNAYFMIDSTLQQVEILEALGFRPPAVAAARAVLDAARQRTEPEALPRAVFLFSGHMVDAPGRPQPRFPPSKVESARNAIAATLDELGAAKGDLALCGGACGGDLLFALECLKRQLRLEVRIPFPEPEFLERSVLFCGEKWRDAYKAVVASPLTSLLVMPDELGEAPPSVDPFVRNNLWQLYSAMSRGPERLRFICLWDGNVGAGPGGTDHMMKEVNAYASTVRRIDPAQLKES